MPRTLETITNLSQHDIEAASTLAAYRSALWRPCR